MSFTINIGYTTDRVDKVNKSFTPLSPAAGVSISPLSSINQLSPVFVVDYNAAYLSANYVVVGAPLNRKYYCGVSVDTAGRMVLTCTCDYLSSFNLANCPIQVTRNGGIGKPTDYPDDKFPIKPNQCDITSTIKTTNELDVNISRGYVLTVIGGGV